MIGPMQVRQASSLRPQGGFAYHTAAVLATVISHLADVATTLPFFLMLQLADVATTFPSSGAAAC